MTTIAPTMGELYPNGDGYHEAHEAYIGAVADAFDAAGITALDWYADPNDPRDGAIQLDPKTLNTEYDGVWVGWQEERGWTVLQEVEHEHRDNSKYVNDLNCCLIASPESVVRSVCEHFAIPPGSIKGDDFPDVDFGGHTFDVDNVGLELALRRYAETTA
jgi:hypothetical protein